MFWNVNGLRSALSKGLSNIVAIEKPDIFCCQEVKVQEDQLNDDQKSLSLNYRSIFSCAEKKGYSGVASFFGPNITYPSPAQVKRGIGIKEFDSEGRFLITEHEDFDLYNLYYPSGTTGEVRQKFKYKFLDAFHDYVLSLPKAKQNRAIILGDFNICHREIDIHHPDKATKLELSGFLPDERKWMDKFTALGFVDSFRHIHGDVKSSYTWWSFRANSRKKNLGWRIDYIFVAKALSDRIRNATILSDVIGSDHCPITLELDVG